MKILVVDDSASTLSILSHFIEKNDEFEVIGYTDPLELVAELDGLNFDIAVVDYVMPGLDGPQVMEKIRANPKFANVPILVLTANTDRETRLDSLSNGAIDFINKPVEPIEFGTRLKNIGQLRAAQRLLEDESRLLNSEVEARTRILLEREQDILDIVTKTAGFRSGDTGRHPVRVGKYSAAIAEQLGLANAFCQNIAIAAQMHDIGKVALSDEMLNANLRPAASDAASDAASHAASDPAQLEVHTSAGHEILADSKNPILIMAASIAQSHHEKWDGSGYPSGRQKNEVPVEARIVAVADCFDNLATGRLGEDTWSVEDVAAHLNAQSGTAFDPEVLAAFNRALPKLREILVRYGDVIGNVAAKQDSGAAA